MIVLIINKLITKTFPIIIFISSITFGYEIKLRIEGRVLDKNNREVSGVKVQIKYGIRVITETKTNAKGRFKITGKHNFPFEEIHLCWNNS